MKIKFQNWLRKLFGFDAYADLLALTESVKREQLEKRVGELAAFQAITAERHGWIKDQIKDAGIRDKALEMNFRNAIDQLAERTDKAVIDAQSNVLKPINEIYGIIHSAERRIEDLENEVKTLKDLAEFDGISIKALKDRIVELEHFQKQVSCWPRWNEWVKVWAAKRKDG